MHGAAKRRIRSQLLCERALLEQKSNADCEIVHEAGAQKDNPLQHSVSKHKVDRESVLEAVAQKGKPLHCAVSKHKADREIVLEVAAQG